ncbi:MAG TPA: hypothetical protein DCY20_01940 [Firmicutes bacterium]|nr:hypothetical protein [Bacillota bacterium]
MSTHTDSTYKETISHGELAFPIKLYHTILKKKQHDLYLHWHAEMEIIYIAHGFGTFQIDNAPLDVCEGDILFIKKGALHSGTGSTLGCECYTLVFNLSFLQNQTFDVVESTYLMPLSKEVLMFPLRISPDDLGYAAILDCIKNMILLFETKPCAFELIVKGNLLSLFGLLFQNNHIITLKQPPLINKKLTAIKAVIAYIHEHYDQKISIKTLASISGYSDYHFIRFFQDETGMKCTDYMNHVRLSKAHHLLQQSDKSITEIAFDCGYENLSYFCKKYKNHYGMTPASSRRHS